MCLVSCHCQLLSKTNERKKDVIYDIYVFEYSTLYVYGTLTTSYQLLNRIRLNFPIWCYVSVNNLRILSLLLALLSLGRIRFCALILYFVEK